MGAFRAALPGAAIHVCDNGSDDATAEAATAAGAEVIVEEQRGKGRAMRRLFEEVDADIYVMADGDGTYDAASAPRLIDILTQRNLDLVVGARKRVDAHAYTPLRRLGNRLFSALARWRCGPRVRDLLSGYRVLSRRFVERFPARSEGFEIETELTLFAASSPLAWDEVECPYFARPEGSTSKLKAFRDGFRILRTLLFSSQAARPDAPAAGSGIAQERAGALRAAVLIGAVTLAATVVFLALNWFAVRADPEPVAEALRASYAHPERTLEDSPERFNDCLISLMALDRDGSTWERTVSPRRVYRYTRPQRPCDALKQRLDHGAVDDSDYLTVFYHQYWAGQRVMLQWLLPRLGVDGLRRLLSTATFILLGLGLLLPIALAALNRLSRFGAAASAVVFVCLLLFLDLDDRAGSFTTGASNVLTLVLLLALPLLRIAHWRPKRQVLLFAVFGALIAYHELLFGSALIGLVAMLLGLSIAAAPPSRTASASATPPEGAGSPRAWRRRLLVRCAAAYVGCLSAVFLLRVLVAELVFREPVLFKFWDQLTFRLYGAPRSSIHPEIDGFYTSRVPMERFLDRVGARLDTIGLGSDALALVLIGIAAVTLIVGTVYVLRHWWTLEDPWRWAGTLAAGWAVPAWYTVFLAHTMAHVPVTIRFVALLYAAAAVLAVGAVMFRRRTA